jgi:hypothetical protein
MAFSSLESNCEKLADGGLFGVDVIMSHEGAFSLRLRGHLLYGLCRIYYNKVTHLYNDSTRVLVKVKNVRSRP